MAAHHYIGTGADERRHWLAPDKAAALESTVQAIAVAGKGISACDESGRTINPRFANVGIEATEEMRRVYRETLFSAPGATDCLTAVILDPETVFQQDSNGTPFPEVLSKQGLIPGVKPSLTVYKLPGTAGETTMQGLDGDERCVASGPVRHAVRRVGVDTQRSDGVDARRYYAAGCRFAKWRSPLTIDVAAGTPSALAIETNCRDLARYALICQSEGLVPIVEPDLVLKGAHSLEDAVEANARVLGELVRGMQDYGVHLPRNTAQDQFCELWEGPASRRPRSKRSPTRTCACCGASYPWPSPR